MPNNISAISPSGTPSSLDAFSEANDAISFKEQLPDLAQKLRDALTSKFQESPLFKQYETAGQNFLSAPQQIRADISSMQQTSGVPLSPTQQGAIESSRRAAAFAPLQTSSLMLNQAQGGLEDIIGGGVKAFEAAAGAKSERANLLNQMRQQEIERNFKQQGIDLDWARLGETQSKEQDKANKELSGTATGVSELLNKINDVRNMIRTGKAPTGFMPGLKFQLQKRGILGTPSPETSRLSTSISDLNTQLFELAGKAFTGPEKSILEGLVIGMGSDKDYIDQQLTQMETIAIRKRDELVRQFLLSGE